MANLRCCVLSIFCFFVVAVSAYAESVDSFPWLIYSDKEKCVVTLGNKSNPAVVHFVSGYGIKGVDNQAILKELKSAIKRGCSISATSSAGFSPLNAAIMYEHPQLVEYLLEKGADPNNRIKDRDPNNRIKTQRQTITGMNSFEFIDLLIKVKGNSKVKQEIRELLLRSK